MLPVFLLSLPGALLMPRFPFILETIRGQMPQPAKVPTKQPANKSNRTLPPPLLNRLNNVLKKNAVYARTEGMSNFDQRLRRSLLIGPVLYGRNCSAANTTFFPPIRLEPSSAPPGTLGHGTPASIPPLVHLINYTLMIHHHFDPIKRFFEKCLKDLTSLLTGCASKRTIN